MSSQHDGNGRLWERFELANINDRIENIYQHFENSSELNSSQESGLSLFEQQDQLRHGIQSQLNELLKDLEVKFNEKTRGWKQENIDLKSEVNGLKNQLRDLKRENGENEKEKQNLENKYKTLRMGLDQIMNASNTKNKERMEKLTQQLRAATIDRDNVVKQAKKDKKESEDFMHDLQEKYDNLQSKYRKLLANRDDLSKDRDICAENCGRLENIIRENRDSENEGLKEKLLNTKNDVRRLQRNNDDLRLENDKIKDDYRVLEEKYELEKEAFSRAIEQHQMDHLRQNEASKSGDHREDLRKMRDEMNRVHQKELKKRENEWTKAKNESIDTLDREYKKINKDKDKQIATLEKSNDELKRTLDELKNEIRRLQNENKKMEVLNDKIQQLNDEMNKKAAELIQLRTDLSKYKILWQHFFGLDAPLKEEIEKVNEKLDRLERSHNIQSPIPKKRRRVIIESLSQWSSKTGPPLILDTIPSPNDEYQRIELYNIHDKVIELKGFKLRNGYGDEIVLDSQRQVKPGGCIGISLTKRRHRHDILYDPSNQSASFCKFTNGEVIWLCDSFEDKVQIFPITEVIYDNLVAFQGQIGAPLLLKQMFNEDDGYQGFEFKNQTGKKIKLKEMYFRNKRDTMRVAIPFKLLPKNGIIRLIIAKDRSHHRISENDLIVSPDQITDGIDDALLLCDAFGNDIELYNLEGAAMDMQAHSERPQKTTECFIM